MSWLGLVILILAAWLAFKVVKIALKIALFVVVFIGAYWFLAPLFDWPPLLEVVHVLGG